MTNTTQAARRFTMNGQPMTSAELGEFADTHGFSAPAWYDVEAMQVGDEVDVGTECPDEDGNITPHILRRTA